MTGKSGLNYWMRHGFCSTRELEKLKWQLEAPQTWKKSIRTYGVRKSGYCSPVFGYNLNLGNLTPLTFLMSRADQ